MDAIVVTLRGQPQGKGRPRSRIACQKGGKRCHHCGQWTKPFIVVYTPEETRNYEDALKYAARAAMRSKPPIEGPIAIVITAVMQVPRSWSAKKRDAALAGVIRPTSVPDWDNIAKTSDALKDVVFKNDSQIVDSRTVKVYGEDPMLKIEVRPLEAFAELFGEEPSLAMAAGDD